LILTPCRPNKLSVVEDKNNQKLIDKISIITCNKTECETLFGTDDIESTVKKYPNKLIVTLGKDGLMYYNGTRVIKMPAIPVDVVDTIGAGDTLCGNLACFLSQNLDLEHALRRAMYASAMKVQVKSAQEGMPYREDLDDFIETKRNQRFDYKKELNLAIKIVKEAYSIVKETSNYHIATKSNNTLVTDVDINVENYLMAQIKSNFENDNFLTEETTPDGKLKDRTWVIDPIDGTSQFIKGTPYWGIQLAFYDKGATRFAIIYLPMMNEFYYAAENVGAFINNNKILSIPAVPLNQCIVEFGGTIYKQLDKKKAVFNKLVKEDHILVGNLLHINSSCISFTNLLSKRTDALIVASTNPWDIMPGMFLLNEAGISREFLDFDKKISLYTNNEEVRKIILE
jgi:fructose-1,6-bisphosphatase/inositol monophosphatase family enzyme